MNDTERYKEKIRKLLALSKSGNENEAASALGKANELLEKYGLDEAGLRFESVKIKSPKTYIPWRAVIANAVSWLYGCHAYRSCEGHMVFTGGPVDAFMAGEMYAYLAGTVERCAKKAVRKNAGYRFRRDFKYGMADRLYDRIMKLGAACSWAPRRDAAIEEARTHVETLVEMGQSGTRKMTLNKTAVSKGNSVRRRCFACPPGGVCGPADRRPEKPGAGGIILKSEDG